MGLYRSPEGVVTEIDDDSASALVAGGYVPISSAQAGAPRESPASGGLTGAINAGATSLLSGATLGLSDVALKAFMTRGEAARLAADREANPVVSGVGQFVGAIAPSLAAPETLLGKAPSAVLSRAVAPLVERGGVAALVGSGLEGSAYGAGAYLSDMALGNRKLSAEGLAGALGGGFAFGVGGGAAVMGIEKGAIAARRMFARVADGGERAATEAEQLWRATHQSTLETYDAAADMAKAHLAKARATRESAGLARDQASAAHAELSALRPELDAAHAAATGLDAKIAAIEAADAPAASISVGSMEDLDRLVAEHFQAKSELDDLLQRIEAPDLGGVAPPGLGVPIGEFGPIGARGVQSSEDMARRALGEATPPVAMDATGAAAPKALREGASGTPARRAIEPSIPTYDAIKAHEVKADDYLEQVVSAKSIADRGYYEPSGAGVDPVRVAKAKSAIADGQRDPIKLNISPEGKITITDGRHRLAAAIEADAPVKVKWSTGLAPATDDVARGGARMVDAASAGGDLEALLRGTSERLAAGEDLNVIGAPARAEYIAAKASRGKAFAERGAASLEVDTAKEAARRRLGIGEHRRVYRRLELAQDAALERAAVAAEPAERAAALAEARGIEQQLTGMGPAPAAASEDIARLAPAITKYERKSAELVESLGDVAPPLAREQAAAFRAAEDAADRKMMDRATRAVDDGIEMPQVGKDRRPSANSPAAPKLVTSKQEMRNADVAYKRARAVETEAKIGAKSAAEQATTARAAAGAPPTPAPGKPSMLGTIATAVGLAGELGVPGVPKPHDIPVIGPLLSAYIKYRALKATAGRFVGRVSATGDARAAALVARTKDKIATAVDRSLGLVASAAHRARPGFVAASGVIGRRLFDDGAPDAPRGASRQEQAAVRIREIITAASRPDMITALVRREMHDVVDPDLIAAAEQHLIARFAHLADVVPKPPPDNAYAQRPWTPSPSATHEVEQRLAVIHDPALALAMIHDPHGALSSPAAADTFRKGHPELFALAKQRLISRMADMEDPMPRDARLRASAFFQIPLDISLDPSHIAIVRAPEPPEPHPSPTGAFSVAKMYDPLNTRGR